VGRETFPLKENGPFFQVGRETFPLNKMEQENRPHIRKLKNKSLFREMWDFLKVRKAYWLIPTIVLLLLVGILIVFSQSSVLSAFIYALF